MSTISTAISLLRAYRTGRDLYREFGDALGLRQTVPAPQSSLGRIVTAAGLVGGGVVVGIGIGMLVAPMTGRELREKISDQAGELLTELVFKDTEEPTDSDSESEPTSEGSSAAGSTGSMG